MANNTEQEEDLVQSIFDKNRIDYEGVYEPRAKKEIATLIEAEATRRSIKELESIRDLDLSVITHNKIIDRIAELKRNLQEGDK